MEFSLPIFLIVLGLGILQLAVGVVFGRCLPGWGRRDEAAVRHHFDAVRRLVGGVQQVVAGVAHDVGHHRTRLREVHLTLEAAQSDEPGRLNQFVLGSLARLMEINEELQSRLTAAETRLQQQTEQIESHVAEARTDPLTRLPNRRAFDDAMVRRIAEYQRRLTPFCVSILDVDHFKQLNDRYGHLAGDHVLRRIGDVLRAVAGEGELVARIGGEEFGVILPRRSTGEACHVIEAIRTSIAAESFQFEETPLQATVSLGLAAVESGDDPITLVRRADEALYAAKRGGRNCAYLHNGQTCERIQPDGPEEAELHQICDELRRRVAELTTREAQPAEQAAG